MPVKIFLLIINALVYSAQATALQFICEYTHSVTSHKATLINGGEKISIFWEKNSQEAFLLSSQQQIPLTIYKNKAGLSFIAKEFDTGLLAITIDRQMQSVQSQHSFKKGHIDARQLYGQCVVE